MDVKRQVADLEKRAGIGAEGEECQCKGVPYVAGMRAVFDDPDMAWYGLTQPPDNVEECKLCGRVRPVMHIVFLESDDWRALGPPEPGVRRVNLRFDD